MTGFHTCARPVGAMAALFLLAAASAALPSAARTDTVVRYRVEANLVQSPSRGAHECETSVAAPRTGDVVTVTWGGGNARVDRPGLSVILPADRKQVHFLFHRESKVASIKYPIAFKKYRTEFEQMVGAEMMQFRLETPVAPETVEVLGREVTRYAAQLVNESRRQWRVIYAPSTDLPADPQPAVDLRKAMHELRFGGYGWSGVLALDEGLPLIWQEVESHPGAESDYREKVVAIEEREVAADTYAVPADYERVDFDPLCMRSR